MKIKSILFVALLISFSHNLKAQANIDISASREELDIAATYINELKDIYKRIGVNVSMVILPNSRINSFFEKSNVDAIALKTSKYGDKHPDAIRIGVPVYKDVKFRLYAKKSELHRIKKLDNAYVVTSLGCMGCREFIEKYDLKVTNFQRTLKSCFNVLLKKRSDLALIPDAMLKKEHLDILVPFDNRVLTTTYYHYIHKRLAHLKPRIEEEFKKSIAKGSFIPKKLVEDK